MIERIISLFGLLAVWVIVLTNASNFTTAAKGAAGAVGGLFNAVARGQ